MANEWSASSRGRFWPVASGLDMTDGVEDVAVLGQPPRGEPVQGRQFLWKSAAQLEPEQVPAKRDGDTGTMSGVSQATRRNALASSRSRRMRSEALLASQQIGKLAVDPVEQRGAKEKLAEPAAGWQSSISASRYSATVRLLPENSRTNRSGSWLVAIEIAASPGSRPAQPSVRWCSLAIPPADKRDARTLEDLAGPRAR